MLNLNVKLKLFLEHNCETVWSMLQNHFLNEIVHHFQQNEKDTLAYDKKVIISTACVTLSQFTVQEIYADIKTRLNFTIEWVSQMGLTMDADAV